MPIMIALLRGVNVGGHHKIKMEELRALCQSLKLRDSQTYVQSGNVVFRSEEANTLRLAKRLEEAIQRKFGFHADVVLRTAVELKDCIARSPFAARKGLEPGKLIVTFFASDLEKERCDQIRAIRAQEEIRLAKRELYIYFPDGMGRSKLVPVLDRTLKKTGTARNWNTVTKLLEMAEALEGAEKSTRNRGATKS
jgi:uncharacterized protein (DUF1697 family)